MRIKPFFLILTLSTLAFSACKTARVARSSSTATPPVDTVSTPAPTYYITEKGDTLQELGQEITIGIHRLIKDTLVIAGVGDIMLGTNFPKPSYLPPDSGRALLAEVKPFLQNTDVVFGNLEGVILNDGGDQKQCKNPDLCYLFRSPEYLAGELKDAGFDVMSTANNHAGDFGDTGRKNTMRVLDSLGIYHAGQQVKPYETFMKHGMKYGFAAFAPNTGTMSINDHPTAIKIVQLLDSICDVVIVSFHGGAEGKKYQNVTRTSEKFYGENRGNVYQFSHDLIDAGADIIFGHGPHVVRAIEVYQDRFIAYSLGNFCTYARFNLSGPNALAPLIKIQTDSEGKFLLGQIIPFVQRAPGGPIYDQDHLTVEKIKELTKEDFPTSNLNFDNKGYFQIYNQ